MRRLLSSLFLAFLLFIGFSQVLSVEGITFESLRGQASSFVSQYVTVENGVLIVGVIPDLVTPTPYILEDPTEEINQPEDPELFLTQTPDLQQTRTPDEIETEVPTPTKVPTENELPTPTQIVKPTETESVKPTLTPTPKPTQESTEPIIEESIPSDGQTATPDFQNLVTSLDGVDLPYNLQFVAPLYLPNFVHTDAACDWMGVAGQVLNTDGLPADDLVVVVEGFTADQHIVLLGYTGLAQAYGPGGYEIVLGESTFSGTFWVQLFDLDSNPQSEVYLFDMPGTCDENLAIINFMQTSAESKSFLPFVEP